MIIKDTRRLRTVQTVDRLRARSFFRISGLWERPRRFTAAEPCPIPVYRMLPLPVDRTIGILGGVIAAPAFDCWAFILCTQLLLRLAYLPSFKNRAWVME